MTSGASRVSSSSSSSANPFERVTSSSMHYGSPKGRSRVHTGEQSSSSKLQLYLRGNRLQVFSSALFELHNLVVLTIGNNDLEELPPAIGQLINLRELNISQNRLVSCGRRLRGKSGVTDLESTFYSSDISLLKSKSCGSLPLFIFPIHTSSLPRIKHCLFAVHSVIHGKAKAKKRLLVTHQLLLWDRLLCPCDHSVTMIVFQFRAILLWQLARLIHQLANLLRHLSTMGKLLVV